MLLDDGKPEIHVAVDDGGELTIGDDIVTKRDQAAHTVSTNGVKSEISGQSVAVTQSSVSVDDGALEVM